MFSGKLAYLNKEHMRSKLQTTAGAENLIDRATTVVAKELGLGYVAVLLYYLEIASSPLLQPFGFGQGTDAEGPSAWYSKRNYDNDTGMI